MADITGASLSQIYDRLRSAPSHHPVGAKTFIDWSVEAGDMITITRDGRQYQSPVHTSSMNWKGGAAELDVGSTGNEKRDPVAKTQKRKYNSGSSGVRNSEKLYAYEVNQDHLLYEVYDSQGRFSKLEVTVRGLFHEVYDTNGAFSKLSNTVKGLTHEVYDSQGRFSRLENTVKGLTHEVYDTDGSFSRLSNTVKGLTHEVYDTNGSFSRLSNTVKGLHHEVYEEGGAISELNNTADGFNTRISKVVDKSGRILSASIATAINQSSSEVYIDADHIKISGDLFLTGRNGALGISGGNLATVGNIQAGLDNTKYIRGKTLRLVGASSSQGVDEQILTSEDIKNMIVRVDTSTPNTLKMWKHSDPDDRPSVTFNKAVSLSGAWSGTTYSVSATAGVISGTAPSTSVYLQVDGTANPSKDVYAKIFHDNPSVQTNQLTSKQLELVESTGDKKVYLYAIEGSTRLTKGAVSTQSTYNNGWTYGQGQRTRATRDATSQELTVKTLDYGQRWTIVDTYTAPNGTTSDVKYTVASKADRYNDGYSAGYNAGWDYGQEQRTRSAREATSSEVTIKTLSSEQRWTIVDTYTKSSGSTSTVKYTVEAPKVNTASDIELYEGGAGQITRSTNAPSGNNLTYLAQALVQAYLNQDGKGRYVRFPATIRGKTGTKYYYIHM